MAVVLLGLKYMWKNTDSSSFEITVYILSSVYTETVMIYKRDAEMMCLMLIII